MNSTWKELAAADAARIRDMAARCIAVPDYSMAAECESLAFRCEREPSGEARATLLGAAEHTLSLACPPPSDDREGGCQVSAARYRVSAWHGEGGSIFDVRDRVAPDDCCGTFSTIAYGAGARAIADRLAADMNAAPSYGSARAVCRAAHRTYARRPERSK